MGTTRERPDTLLQGWHNAIYGDGLRCLARLTRRLPFAGDFGWSSLILDLLRAEAAPREQ